MGEPCEPRAPEQPGVGTPPSGQSRPNHREPVGAATATASTAVLDCDAWTYVSPRAAAARAVATSPSECARAWFPTGPRMTGAGIATPSTVALRSRSARSMNIRGTIRHARSARAFARTAAAPPAQASRCRRAASDSTFSATASRSDRLVVKIGLTSAAIPAR